MFIINSFSVSRLNNAEFVGLFINLKSLITRCEAATMGLDTTLTTAYDAQLQKLIDQVRISQSSEMVAKMNAANDKRIRLFKRIYYSLRKIELVEDGTSMATLRDKVSTLILKTYSLALIRLPQQELTTVLSGFIYDMQNKFDEDDLDDMGVVAELSNLEIANNAFISAYNDRAEERATATSALTQQLRQEMVDLYASLCFTVQFYANSTLEANATKAAACQEFIGIANAIIADAKSRYNARINALHGADAPSSDVNGAEGAGNATEGGGNADAGDTPAGGDSGDSGDSGNSGNAGNAGTSGNTGNAGTSGNTGDTGNDTPAGGSSQPDGGPDPIVTDENAEF